jgi:MoCo/4Fe-4S cofactor protein with predicted Tat translocation signal
MLMASQAEPLDLAKTRRRLAGMGGKDYWRSLEELGQTSEFQEMVEREFSGPAGGWTDPVNRRQFLGLIAASLGLAGLSGCAPAPPERIVPYVRTPIGIVPGRRQYFATAMPLPGDALGLLVESHEGRPTKIEGNPEHPGSPKMAGGPEKMRFGPTNLFAQASLLTLYDPDRSAAVTHLGNISTWSAFMTALQSALRPRGERTRLRVLTGAVTSPSLVAQLGRLVEKFPRAKWHAHEAIGRDNVARGARQAFGDYVEAQYRLERADVIVALDADFLSEGPYHVRHLHDFAVRRRVRQGRTDGMNRLYVVESMPSGTGAIADHRLALRSSDIEPCARALAGLLDERFRAPAEGVVPGVPAGWLEALAQDLGRRRGTGLVVAGAAQPPAVHALAHALNDFLGNVGHTVFYTEPVTAQPPGTLRELVDEIDAGGVDVLVILGSNPAYTAPADLHFAERVNRVPFRVHLGLYADETSVLCHWHVPEAHFLESWGDVRSHDGTVSVLQPLTTPLYGGKTTAEVLGVFFDSAPPTGYETVRGYWQNLFPSASPRSQAEEARVRSDWERQGLLSAFTGDFETWWRQTVHDGLAARTQLPAKTVALRPNWNVSASARPAGRNDIEIVFRPDPTVYDGRFANNGWLQELPKPLSKLTWDNAVYLSPATAVRLGFASADRPEQANERVVGLTYRERTLEGPLWVLPGHADDSITVHLGYGRTRAGRVGSPLPSAVAGEGGLGFNAYRLRTSAARGFDTGVRLRLTERRRPLACTQHHQLMENRDLVRSGTVDRPPAMPQRRRLTLYDEAEHPRSPNQWGMVIDLNVCTGCSACVVACQAENNIPVVGKEEVRRGRAMHWLRVDRYFEGPAARPALFFQPVPCMHCENAPCEVVCPVAATVHSSDGLNDMVYNRCVGTRYCSNNCPYKVRRFNFLQYADFTAESLRLLRNPEVTVRSRGVMEKCTYCVQRIRAGQIAAQLADRPVRDGDVVTACQAACPASAIIFGDLNDKDEAGRPQSEVGTLQGEPLRYALLEELNTRPRTTYLAALKNPNPEIAPLESR